jgi:glucose-6-phosphate isomerase
MPSLRDLADQASNLRDCPAWRELQAHAEQISRLALGDLLDTSDRYAGFSREHGDLILDFSRHLMTSETFALLLQLADQRHLGAWIEYLFSGSHVNNTEDRPALHMALRRAAGEPVQVEGQDVMPMVESELTHVLGFAEALRTGRYKGFTGKRITNVVNIGIGGSDLGLVMADQALARYRSDEIQTHFVSNIDGSQLADLLGKLAPDSTLFIICSKSFKTLETQLNGAAARQWLVSHLPDEAVGHHFAAISVNDAAMDAFGIGTTLRFRIWDWVGGRYSLWSAVGLSLAIAIGAANFRKLLAGAAEMDEHFRTAEFADNLPVILAMVGIWNQNFLGTTSHAVLPYDQRLANFPAFLQQLEMESNGKGVTRDGHSVEYPTGGVIWGQAGSNAQHSFFQLLHQGTAAFSMDFIAPARASSDCEDQHLEGLANMLAQAEAFARGHSLELVTDELRAAGRAEADIERLAPHKVHPGNRPSNILLLKQLTPHALGALIALYEHKVFVQSVVWGINPFDQWGVELGKIMATKMSAALGADGTATGLPGIAQAIREWRKA